MAVFGRFRGHVRIAYRRKRPTGGASTVGFLMMQRLEEVRFLVRQRGSPSLRLLQLREGSRLDPLHARYGGWRDFPLVERRGVG